MNLSLPEPTQYKNKLRRVKFLSILFTILFILASVLTFSANTITTATPRQENNPPVAGIVKPTNGQTFDINENVHFDASNSSDPDDDPMTYHWDFGDGSSGWGVTTSHKYTQPAVPIITLTVYDAELNDTDRVVIIIGGGGGQNQPPSATIISPSNFDTFTVNELIEFDGSNSSDPDEDALSYEWNFGDGNSSTNMIATHAYGQTGAYRVRLNVSDGIFNDSARIIIFVNNTPPRADAGGDQVGFLGEVLEFDGSNSSDPDRVGGITNYTWSMGDKTTKYGDFITHTYTDYDKYLVTLTVTDDDGATDSDEIQVTITNSPPYAVLRLVSTDTIINTDIEFDASASYDDDGYIEDYFYNFGDGYETDWISLSNVVHKYKSLGQFTITLQVRDNMNTISEAAEIIIDVTEKENQPPKVRITYPLDDDSVAGVLTIQGTAEDPDNRIESVDIRIDDGAWDDAAIINIDGHALDWEYQWNTELQNDGRYTITTRAWDGNKHSPEFSIDVNINNRPTTYIDLTEKLDPEKSAPGGNVELSGLATYDTNVPVTDAEVTIQIVETQKQWSTTTDSQGKYLKAITAPNKAGKYTVAVYVTDGTLEKDISKKLTVQEPPDLVINNEDIKHSPKKVQEKDKVNITATIKNIGELDTFATITFYQDTTDILAMFQSYSKTIPKDGSVDITASWTARQGTHSIIVVISGADPAEEDLTNNEASINITVSGRPGDSQAEDEKAQENPLDAFTKLPKLYQYSIIGIIILIILIIIAVAARAGKSKKKAKEPKTSTGAGAQKAKPGKGKAQSGAVVFKPLDEGDTPSTSTSVKAKVKFESIDSDEKADRRPPGMVVFKSLDKDKELTIKISKPTSSKAAIVVLIFAILSIVMMGAALYMPWYTITATADTGDPEIGEYKLEQSYSFSEIEISDNLNDMSFSASWDSEQLENLEAQKTVYKRTEYLVIAGMIMGILLLIGAIVAILKKGKKGAVFFGLLAMIFCLLSPILFMTWHPGAYATDYETDSDESEEDGPHNSFMGTFEQDIGVMNAKMVWGPAIGWYLAIMSFIFALIGFITALAIPKPKPTMATTKAPATKPTKFKFEEVSSSSDVVFKPIDDDENGITEAQTGRLERQNVKFESTGFR